MANRSFILQQVNLLKQQGKQKEAQQWLGQQLPLFPDDVDLITEYIDLCFSRDDYISVVPWIQRLHDLMGGKLTPRHHMMMRHYIRRLADWRWYKEELKWVKNHLDQTLIQPFYLFSLPLKLSEHQKLMRAFYHQKGWDKIPSHQFDFSNRSFQNRPIKIGFVSPNWRAHPEMSLTPSFYQFLNDSDRFQVYFYDLTPLNPKDMPEKQKIVQISPKTFKNVAQMNDEQLANLIFLDQIDILVDVAGLTVGNKVGTFVRQPAPIQVSWLGYAETLCGLPGFDYLIADSYVIPPDTKDKYDEKVLYLEPSYYPYDENSWAEQFDVTRAELGLPEKAFVFAYLNNDYKLTPDYFEMWIRILKKVPNAVLWIYAQNEIFRQNLRDMAKTNGVKPERLFFYPHTEHKKYLMTLKCADLFLDSQYYNAHTTAADILFAGVPILTCPGERWVSRVCGSILNALKMNDLITKDMAEYEEKAVFLATHPEELKKIKEKLAQSKKEGNFFNSKAYAEKFAQICLDLITDYCSKK